MSMKIFWVQDSQKSGLVSEESFIVGRGTQVFLRILGKEPKWQIMTATASEDDGRLQVCSNRSKLVQAAFVFGYRHNTEPVSKRDWKNREYVLICNLEQKNSITESEFNQLFATFIEEFFVVFDEFADAQHDSRDEMIEIYESLSDSDMGDGVYLSDGVWLASDGSIEDRGR